MLGAARRRATWRIRTGLSYTLSQSRGDWLGIVCTAGLFRYNGFSIIQKELKMDKWTCTICGYVYDPEEGDPDNGVAAGTPFEEVPDDWVCPLCGADKSAFEKS